jgi:hypothetical protein
MITLIASIISAILYRIGGAGKEEIKFANSQYRDIGCPVIVLIVLLMAGYTWYLCLASALLVLGFIRTYWDFLYKNNDNLYLHGAFLGLSMIPLAWSGVPIWKIVAYTSILTFSVGGLNTFCTRVRVPYSVWVEELFRGLIVIEGLRIVKII